MAELEVHTHHAGHEENPLIIPVSLTMSILAVLVAAATLMGHRSHTEELLLQAHATDQWNFYQAKNIRMHEMQVMVDQLGVLTNQNSQKADLLREKYQKEAERYESDKEGISEKAKELENERDVLRARADRFDAGEGILEIALVICSLTLLTDKKFFWYAAMLIGAVGIVAALSGFLRH